MPTADSSVVDRRLTSCIACEANAFVEPALAPIYRRLCAASRAILNGVDPCEAAFAQDVSPGNLTRLLREYVGTTPAELVRLGAHGHGDSDQLSSAPSLALAVPYEPPLDFAAVAELLRSRLVPNVEGFSGSAYQRTFEECGSVGLLEVRDSPGNWLEVRVQAARWSGLVHVVERIRRIFNVDVNAREAQLWLRHDPIVGRLVEMRPGVRPPGSWSLFEGAVKAVLGCGWDVRGQDWLGELVERAGSAMAAGSSAPLNRLFPSPQQVASVAPDRLGLPFVKARTIRQLAQVATTRSPVVAEPEPLQRRLSAFVALDGVGPVTAARFAWILGDPDAYPEKAGAPLPGTAITPSRQRARHVADRWRPYRSFAYAQLALSDGLMGGTFNDPDWTPFGHEEGLSA